MIFEILYKKITEPAGGELRYVMREERYYLMIPSRRMRASMVGSLPLKRL